MGLKTLVLLRHGESTWNMENRFTGWTDVDLSPRGFEEARAAGRQMLSDGYVFDVAFASILKRAIRTLWLALDEMDLMWIPVYKSWRLNERHYGALQGLNKLETVERVLPYWNQMIAPAVRAGKRVLIASHGNSLRALVKYLDKISDEAIVELNIPTGIPLVYELNDDLTPIRHFYLGDAEAIERASQAVADQTKKVKS